MEMSYLNNFPWNIDCMFGASLFVHYGMSPELFRRKTQACPTSTPKQFGLVMVSTLLASEMSNRDWRRYGTRLASASVVQYQCANRQVAHQTPLQFCEEFCKVLEGKELTVSKSGGRD
jgi:hypothetical protein